MIEPRMYVKKCFSDLVVKYGSIFGKDRIMTDKQTICKCNDKECGQCSFEEQLKRKEQECEELKKGLNLILTVQKNCKECPHQKLDVDVLVCDLDCATAFKKIAKQTLKKLENKNV